MSEVGVGSVLQGKVAWFDEGKGFGFITYPEGTGKDIFVHYSAILTSGFKSLNEADEVEFTISEGSGGRLQASQVKVVQRSKFASAGKTSAGKTNRSINERKFFKGGQGKR